MPRLAGEPLAEAHSPNERLSPIWTQLDPKSEDRSSHGQNLGRARLAHTPPNAPAQYENVEGHSGTGQLLNCRRCRGKLGPFLLGFSRAPRSRASKIKKSKFQGLKLSGRTGFKITGQKDKRYWANTT